MSLARSVRGEKSAAFVNAVLRRLASEPAAPIPSNTPLAERFAHPGWLVERWVTRFGAARTAQLLEHNNRRPTVVIQPARWTLERLAAALAEAGRKVEPHALGGLCVSGKVSELPGFAEGGFIVQDAAQASLLKFAAIPDGATVWDACAAPGGKAATIARTHRVIATDRGQVRTARLIDTIRRAAPQVPVVRSDSRQPPFRAGSFDAVLVDAPCSATGTLARHPDARWNLSADRITSLTTLPAELLRAAAGYVRPPEAR